MSTDEINITTDKAYLLGLLVGGARINNNVLQIVLPYRRWGDLHLHPERCGQIATDIVKRIAPIMSSIYNLLVSYDVDGEWKIVIPSISTALIQDLENLGLPRSGEFRVLADIRKLVNYLNNKDKVRNFLAGLTDVVGSMEPSHRRYTDAFQTVSFEFKGGNFYLVKEIAKLFISLGVPPDQILWNHPNQHSSIDRYYMKWKKGFKIRIALDDYISQGSFVCQAKREAAIQNRQLESSPQTAQDKTPRIKDLTAVHVDENSTWLPVEIRGYHFIHYLHYAEFFGLHLPGDYEKVLDMWLDNAPRYITPFTVLTKRKRSKIEDIIKNEPYLRCSVYRTCDYSIYNLLELFESNSAIRIWGNQSGGFPINYVLQAISYVVAASTNTNIKGRRVLINYIDNINQHINNYDRLGIRIHVPDRGTCLLVENDEYAALVGFHSEEFTKSLLFRESKYGIKVREPSFDECLKLDK